MPTRKISERARCIHRGRTLVGVLDVALASRFGLSQTGVQRGARLRLARLVRLAQAFHRLGTGLRVEELGKRERTFARREDSLQEERKRVRADRISPRHARWIRLGTLAA